MLISLRPMFFPFISSFDDTSRVVVLAFTRTCPGKCDLREKVSMFGLLSVRNCLTLDWCSCEKTTLYGNSICSAKLEKDKLLIDLKLVNA